MDEWVLYYEARPWTLNAERTWHFQKRAKYVREWRDAFKGLAEVAGIPYLGKFSVEATPILKGHVQDIGNCYPAVKAAIDGVVDAGVAEDDAPQFCRAITINAPEYGPNGLRVVVRRAT